jgi:hypothetical protein
MKSLDPLGISSGARGVVGLPPLLAQIRALSKAKETNTLKLPKPPDEKS